MPHQNVHSGTATAQNGATDPIAPNDEAREQNVSVDAEPRTYAAGDVKNSTLAAPAAGEVADYMDEGDALDGAEVQQGGDHTNRPYRTEAMSGQGPKTKAGQQHERQTGSAD